jgi:hypothetical protein
VKVHDEAGLEFKDLPKAVIKKSIGRKVKIKANKLNPFEKTR